MENFELRDGEDFILESDEVGNFALSGEFLALIDPSDLEALSDRGYHIREEQNLLGLEKTIARLEPPVSFDFQQIQSDIATLAPNSVVDYNHLYTTKSGQRDKGGANKGQGILPSSVFNAEGYKWGKGLKIGMIDTAIRAEHAALANANIMTREFVSFDFKRPKHGTSVASILVGQSEEYTGLLPNAELYAASVFFNSPMGKETTTTQNLVQAINWMVENEVKVINMSLAGPPNAILEAAINRAGDKGVIIVAAVGNEGPAAKPLYPAAYPSVVAVTAVNKNNAVYRYANRGKHIDFAAPGVAILNAAGTKRYQSSSGTSFASPFVAVVLAMSDAQAGNTNEALLKKLKANAKDLGVAGFDPIYGYGLIRPLTRTERTSAD